MYALFVKPTLDLVLALVALIVLSPLMLLAALAILLEDGGPVFFVHERIGRDGCLFKIYKFRSMPNNTELLPSTAAGGLHVTRVGAIIRRLNADELPQLFNVIKQQMSIVGPRPGLPSQTELHEARRANGAITLKPGLTGLAQIRSYDGMSTQVKAELDGEYARRLSCCMDVKVVLLTVRYVFKPQPVY